LQQLFSNRNTCLNLFGMLPPMQIDGNFGITAAISEMLMQSQEDDINLLPALPKEWATGSVHGLRARGGFVVSLDWTGGKLESALIHSPAGGACRVRYGDTTNEVTIRKGQTMTLNGNLKPSK